MAATAEAHPNIAFIKYWGNRNPALNLPANPSLSMNLAALRTVTTVSFDPDLTQDEVEINGERVEGRAYQRVVAHLDRVRALAGRRERARVVSRNDFPTGAGLASSASAFAALTLAAIAAAGLTLSEAALSALARLGSGSAARSIPAGFVEWQTGERHEASFARSIAPPDYWALADVIAIVEQAHKPVTSRQGHQLAPTSPFQEARVATAPARLAACKRALLARDFTALAPILEQDTLMMHAVMMTSTPSLFYWTSETVTIIRAVRCWREEGLPVAFTIDAGPNVHCICLAEVAGEVEERLWELPGVREVLVSGVGGAARLIEQEPRGTAP